MALSAVSTGALAQSNISHQQTEKGRSNPSPEKNLSENKFDDNVTLGQSKRTNASSRVVDENTADKLLSQIKESILAHSKTAISAQANIIPQAAQEFLAEN